MRIGLLDQLFHRVFQRVGKVQLARICASVSSLVRPSLHSSSSSSGFRLPAAMPTSTVSRGPAAQDDIAPGVAPGSGGFELAGVDHHLYPAVVAGELCDPSALTR